MTYRFATERDCPLLGELNHQLIRDEGHRNRMTPAELQARMGDWLAAEYRAILFENEAGLVGYCLYREQVDEIYLRQLFILRELRRRGFGRTAVKLLQKQIWPREKRLTVEVLVANEAAVQFWRAAGYRDYALTLEVLPLKAGA